MVQTATDRLKEVRHGGGLNPGESMKKLYEYNALEELFSDPARHCKGAYLASRGNPSLVMFRREDFEEASQCCLSGGLAAVYGVSPLGAVQFIIPFDQLREAAELRSQLVRAVARHLGCDEEDVNLARFNDKADWEEIRSVVKDAGLPDRRTLPWCPWNEELGLDRKTAPEGGQGSEGGAGA